MGLRAFFWVLTSGTAPCCICQNVGDNQKSPDMPCMNEQGLQKQTSVGTMLSSQDRRALAVPPINRGSTAGQPRVNRWSTADFALPSVYIGFLFSCFRGDVQDSLFDSLGCKSEGCFLAESTRGHPVLPSLAPPRDLALRRPNETGP